MAIAQRLSYFIKNDFLRSFSPLFFSAVMGNGCISILFDVFPYGQGLLMKVFSLIIFFLNVLLFLVFTGWAIARFCSYPKDWMESMNHPKLGLFWGCFPMACNTNLNVAVNVLHEEFSIGGKGFLYFIWALWWINLAISFACCWGILLYVIAGRRHSLEDMSLAWLLPIVTLIVASSSAGVLANALREYSEIHAIITVTTGVFIVTVGFVLSLIVFIMYFQRLFFIGLPEGADILTVFLPLGPCGQAGFAITLVGRNFNNLVPLFDSSSVFLRWPYAGQVINMLCICIAFLLWTLASMFLLFGILGVSYTLRKTRIPFTLSSWGLIFPNGVYAILTITLGQTFNATFFRVYGAAYAVGTFLLWLFVACKSLVYMYDVVFNDPLSAISLSQSPTLEVTQVVRCGEFDVEKKGGCI